MPAQPTAFDEAQDKEINQLKARVENLEELLGAQQSLLAPVEKLKGDVSGVLDKVKWLDSHEGRIKALESGANLVESVLTGIKEKVSVIDQVVRKIEAWIDRVRDKVENLF